jgi:hypothetical protein
MPSSVFISYNHADAASIAPVVALLRGALGVVFHDSTSILPGDDWKERTVIALRESDVIAIFWCVHSARSAEVRFEYNLAIRERKRLMPVLLDSTPMPDELKRYHWVDFRKIASAIHAALELDDGVADCSLAPYSWEERRRRTAIPSLILFSILMIFYISAFIYFRILQSWQEWILFTTISLCILLVNWAISRGERMETLLDARMRVCKRMADRLTKEIRKAVRATGENRLE